MFAGEAVSFVASTGLHLVPQGAELLPPVTRATTAVSVVVTNFRVLIQFHGLTRDRKSRAPISVPLASIAGVARGATSGEALGMRPAAAEAMPISKVDERLLGELAAFGGALDGRGGSSHGGGGGGAASAYQQQQAAGGEPLVWVDISTKHVWSFRLAMRAGSSAVFSASLRPQDAKTSSPASPKRASPTTGTTPAPAPPVQQEEDRRRGLSLFAPTDTEVAARPLTTTISDTLPAEAFLSELVKAIDRAIPRRVSDFFAFEHYAALRSNAIRFYRHHVPAVGGGQHRGGATPAPSQAPPAAEEAPATSSTASGAQRAAVAALELAFLQAVVLDPQSDWAVGGQKATVRPSILGSLALPSPTDVLRAALNTRGAHDSGLGAGTSSSGPVSPDAQPASSPSSPSGGAHGDEPSRAANNARGGGPKAKDTKVALLWALQQCHDTAWGSHNLLKELQRWTMVDDGASPGLCVNVSQWFHIYELVGGRSLNNLPMGRLRPFEAGAHEADVTRRTCCGLGGLVAAGAVDDRGRPMVTASGKNSAGPSSVPVLLGSANVVPRPLAQPSPQVVLAHTQMATTDAAELRKVFATYPTAVVLPRRAAHIDTVLGAAKYRQNGRIPSISWVHLDSGACIARSSQPRVRSGKGSREDQVLCSYLNQSLYAGASTHGAVRSPTPTGSVDTATSRSDNDMDEDVIASAVVSSPNGQNRPAFARPPTLYGDCPAWAGSTAPPGQRPTGRKDGAHKGGAGGGPAGVAAAEGRVLQILDCRSTAAATANFANGGGYELVQNYHNAKLHFLALDNIHGVRRAFERLTKLCGAAQSGDASSLPKSVRTRMAEVCGNVASAAAVDSGAFDAGGGGAFAAKLDQTEWPKLVQRLLWSGTRAAAYLQRGDSVLVHCTDGWDRTSQVVCIATMLLDAHFRTVEGFCELIQREWLEHGHRFADRLAHHRRELGPMESSLAAETAALLADYNRQVHEAAAASAAASAAANASAQPKAHVSDEEGTAAAATGGPLDIVTVESEDDGGDEGDVAGDRLSDTGDIGGENTLDHEASEERTGAAPTPQKGRAETPPVAGAPPTTTSTGSANINNANVRDKSCDRDERSAAAPTPAPAPPPPVVYATGGSSASAGPRLSGREADQASPVFIQFLDAVFQLTHMFPTEFEFSPAFLAYLGDQATSCRFGTFLMNSSRERLQEHRCGPRHDAGGANKGSGGLLDRLAARFTGGSASAGSGAGAGPSGGGSAIRFALRDGEHLCIATATASVWGEVEELVLLERLYPSRVPPDERLLNPLFSRKRHESERYTSTPLVPSVQARHYVFWDAYYCRYHGYFAEYWAAALAPDMGFGGQGNALAHLSDYAVTPFACAVGADRCDSTAALVARLEHLYPALANHAPGVLWLNAIRDLLEGETTEASRRHAGAPHTASGGGRCTASSGGLGAVPLGLLFHLFRHRASVPQMVLPTPGTAGVHPSSVLSLAEHHQAQQRAAARSTLQVNHPQHPNPQHPQGGALSPGGSHAASPRRHSNARLDLLAVSDAGGAARRTCSAPHHASLGAGGVSSGGDNTTSGDDGDAPVRPVRRHNAGLHMSSRSHSPQQSSRTLAADTDGASTPPLAPSQPTGHEQLAPSNAGGGGPLRRTASRGSDAGYNTDTTLERSLGGDPEVDEDVADGGGGGRGPYELLHWAGHGHQSTSNNNSYAGRPSNNTSLASAQSGWSVVGGAAVQGSAPRPWRFGNRNGGLARTDFIPRSLLGACELCALTFTFLKRRHTCRRCSRAVCDRCSSRSVVLPRAEIGLFEDRNAGRAPLRVCSDCFVEFGNPPAAVMGDGSPAWDS